jgi:hypothetical protein
MAKVSKGLLEMSVGVGIVPCLVSIDPSYSNTGVSVYNPYNNSINTVEITKKGKIEDQYLEALSVARAVKQFIPHNSIIVYEQPLSFRSMTVTGKLNFLSGVVYGHLSCSDGICSINPCSEPKWKGSLSISRKKGTYEAAILSILEKSEINYVNRNYSSDEIDSIGILLANMHLYFEINNFINDPLLEQIKLTMSKF